MKQKTLIWIALILAIVALIGYRAYRITSEARRVVANQTREQIDTGISVDTIKVTKQTGILKIPLAVENGRALVSCARVEKFAAGQKADEGVVASVLKNIDIDTGMCRVVVTGTTNGTVFVDVRATGYFVPIPAVVMGDGGTQSVMIADGDIARAKTVKIIDQDNDTAVLTGLADGDMVIISRVNDGDKIRIKQ